MEVIITSNKICLAIDFNGRCLLVIIRDVNHNEALIRFTVGALFGNLLSLFA